MKKVSILLFSIMFFVLLKAVPAHAVDFKEITPAKADTPAEAVGHVDDKSGIGKIYDVPTELFENIKTEYYKFTVDKRSYVFLDDEHGLQITWGAGATLYADWGMSRWIMPYHDIKKSDARYIHVFMLDPGTYYVKVTNEGAYKVDSSQYSDYGGKSESGRGPLTLFARTYLHVIPVEDIVTYTESGYDCDRIISVSFGSGYSGTVQGSLYNHDVFDVDYSKLDRYSVPLTSEDNVFHFYSNVTEATYFFKITLDNGGWKDYPFFIGVPLGKIVEHGNVEADAVEPTCGTEGYSGGRICPVCGYLRSGYKIPVDPSKHVPVVDGKVEATVFNAGITEGSHCKECGAVIEEQKVVKKLKPTIKLSSTKKSVNVNKSFTLTVSKLAKGDSIKSVKASSSKIVKVKKSSKGKYKITGKKKGSTYVTVTLKSGKKAKCKVTVK